MPPGSGPCPTSSPGSLGVGQGVEGQHDPDLDVHIARAGLAGEAFHEGVGHDLIPRAAVPDGGGGIGGLPERGQAGDALLDGQQPGEHGHGVRRRAQRHPPIGAGLAAPRV